MRLIYISCRQQQCYLNNLFWEKWRGIVLVAQSEVMVSGVYADSVKLALLAFCIYKNIHICFNNKAFLMHVLDY